MTPILLLLSLSSTPIGTGAVTYTHQEWAYLNRGRADGLEMGMTVAIERDGRRIGTCVVMKVATHRSVCAQDGFRAGDEFRFFPRSEVLTTPVGSVIAPSPSSKAKREQQFVLQSASVAPVVFTQTNVFADSPLRAEARLSHGAWVDITNGDRPFQRERVDVLLTDVPLGWGSLRANLDLTALVWSGRPQSQRFRNDESPAQLYLYEASIRRRTPEATIVGAVGRVSPWLVPGIAYLDGLQVGWRRPESHVEVGLIAGSLPNTITLAPSQKRWVTGAYWGLDRRPLGSTGILTHAGRLAVIDTPDSNIRGEGELALRGNWGRKLSIDTGVRLGIDGVDGFAVHKARLDLTWGPLDQLRFDIGGTVQTDTAALREDLPSAWAPEHLARTRGYVQASWDLSSRFGLMLRADAARDGSDAFRGQLGTELSFRPGSNLGQWGLGYQEAAGWLPGRTVFLRTSLQRNDWSFMTRVAYLEDRAEEGAYREISTFLHSQYDLHRHFGLRMTALATVPLMGPNGAPRVEPGFGLRATLIGRW